MDTNARYQEWMKMFSQDEKTMAELRAMQGDEKEIASRFGAELTFGTAGMRGVIGAGTNRMNAYAVRRATLGLADLIATTEGGAARGVTIAYDSRRFSKEFALEAALTLCSRGIRALLFDSLQPVPILSFALRHLGAVAGIVITASHNPPEYNGYKVYWEDGGQMPPDRADEVYANMGAHGYADAQPMKEEKALEQGLLTYIGEEVIAAYMRRLQGISVRPELARAMGEKLKIVYSPLNGSGNLPVRDILDRIGMRRVSVVAQQELPDPSFETVGTPNPENMEVYRLAREMAVQQNADLVFATDPDCDRLGCLVRDDDGNFLVLGGNQIGCLLLDYVLRGKKDEGALPGNGAVVKSIVSTQMANVIAASYGVKTYDVLTGFKFIAEKIQEFEDTGSGTFLFGFEESYGYLSSTFVRDKDAVNASMLLAEAAAYHSDAGRTLYQALQALYQEHGFFVEKTVPFDVPGLDGLERMSRLMKTLRGNPPGEIAGRAVVRVRDYLSGVIRGADGETETGMSSSDVLYYELEDGAWLCVRPSGTEPKIKLYVGTSAASMEEADAAAAELGRAGVALIEE